MWYWDDFLWLILALTRGSYETVCGTCCGYILRTVVRPRAEIVGYYSGVLNLRRRNFYVVRRSCSKGERVIHIGSVLR